MLYQLSHNHCPVALDLFIQSSVNCTGTGTGTSLVELRSKNNVLEIDLEGLEDIYFVNNEIYKEDLRPYQSLTQKMFDKAENN